MKYLLLLCFILTIPVHAEDWQKLVELSGEWKFEIGDDMQRAKPDYDDHSWIKIRVPSSWEDEGFPGYDGYAWYRRQFRLEEGFGDKEVYLHLGFIDDVDEVYLNGELVGFSGSFPPLYSTAYNEDREYIVRNDLFVVPGINVIAVRVYDDELEGGILRGDIGLFEKIGPLQPDLNLAGMWRFKTGDSPEWKNPDFFDARWNKIHVPGFWETQGYRDYDGFGWYRTNFYLPEDFRGKKLILLGGKIDDVDETYLNGKRIGRTGRIYDDPDDINFSDEYTELRAYYIPEDNLKFGAVNVLAVRVYDGFVDGGIYEGPVGLITRKKYVEWNRKVRPQQKNFFDLIFGK